MPNQATSEHSRRASGGSPVLKTDPELQRLIPPITAEVRAGLEASIAREGCRDALVVWTEEGVLLDGHNRYEICRRLNTPYDTVGRSFPDRCAAKVWIIENQFARRNLYYWQRGVLGVALEDILRPAARARMEAGKAADPCQNSDEGRVDDEIARVTGVSRDTRSRVRYLQDRVSEQTKARLDSGETTINAEYQKLRLPGLLNQSNSNEWYTPPKYVDAARRVLGGIDLDPASCEMANKTVKALRYFDEEENGLAQDWRGRVFLNPPYGGQSPPFTEKLLAEYRAGRTTAAIILVNANSTGTTWFRPLWDFVMCFPYGRIHYISPVGGQSNAATHGSVFVYLGPDTDRFNEVFKPHGSVMTRYGSAAALTEAGRRGSNSYGDTPDV